MQDRKLLLNKKIISYILAGLLALVGPTPLYAADFASVLLSLFGGSSSGLGGGGQFVNGDPKSQVIPLLQQNYAATTDAAGVANQATALQTKTDIERSNYQAQQAWEREGKLRKDQITRVEYPKMSNLACGMATANQSLPIIETASDYAVATVIDLLTNGMYQNAVSNTVISAKKKADIWCKLGAVTNDETCTTPADPLVAGCDRDRHSCIARKHSIPCDMQAVQQEFAKMSGDSYSPAAKHKECVAAILSIANEFELAGALPTKEELKTTQGLIIRDQKKNAIATAWSGKGNALQEFGEVVSLAKSQASGCDKGIRGNGSGDDVYGLLQERYVNANRSNKVAPFGLPPDDFCLSLYQLRIGKRMLMDRFNERYAGNMSQQQANKAILGALTEQYDPHRDRQSSKYPSMTSEGNTSIRPNRPVGTTDNTPRDQEMLLGAIRQLTAEIRQMNHGVFNGKAQDVRMKQPKHKPAPPQATDASAENIQPDIHDALRDLGLKVSSTAQEPAQNSPAILRPITPEFPTVP